MAENTSAGAKIEEQESQLCLDFGYIPRKNSKLRNSRNSRGRTLSRQRSRSARTATSASSRDPAEDSIEAPPELPAVPHAQTHTATSARKNSLGDEDNIYNAVRGKTHIPVRILRLRFEQQLLRAERRAKDKADAERLLGDKDHLSVVRVGYFTSLLIWECDSCTHLLLRADMFFSDYIIPHLLYSRKPQSVALCVGHCCAKSGSHRRLLPRKRHRTTIAVMLTSTACMNC